jgi:signal transduction histidine kinase
VSISLHRRLVWILLGLIAFTWLTTAALLYFSPGRALEQLIDQQLRQYSHVVKYIAGVFAQQIDEGLPLYEAWQDFDLDVLKKQPLIVAGLEEPGPAPAVNVWLNSRLIGLLEGSPRFEPPGAEGFAYIEGVAGSRWRVYSTYDADSELWIRVGVDFEAAREQVLRSFARTMLPVLVVVPLTVAVLLWGVSRGLLPLNRLAGQIARRRPGQLRAVEERGVPVELSGVVRAINRLMERLANALEGEQRFTANAAHELRTPLAAIKTEVQLCQRQIADQPGKEMLARIERRVDRAGHTVEQLLTLARIEPEAELASEVVDLRALLAESVAETAHLAVERRVEVSLDEGPEIRVVGNPEALAILLRNLLVNAFRYASEESVVRVRLQREPSVLLEISNDCPALSREEFERIRNRFYRVPGSAGQGAGLGLSIVERIAELHGARFEAGPREDGSGFRASVRFPR